MDVFLRQRDAATTVTLQCGPRANTPAAWHWLRPKQTPRLDESIVRGVPGAEYAIHHRLVKVGNKKTNRDVDVVVVNYQQLKPRRATIPNIVEVRPRTVLSASGNAPDTYEVGSLDPDVGWEKKRPTRQTFVLAQFL